jgi:ribosome-associated translation inhibitor RaiA
MIIEFYTPGTAVGESIITYVRDEILKRHKQHKSISRAYIAFSQKKGPSGEEKMCTISLFIAGKTINAKNTCKNFDHASRKAIAALNENIISELKQTVYSV